MTRSAPPAESMRKGEPFSVTKPEDGPQNVDLSYQDTQPLAGTLPYWVRVVQVNRAKAWSSPVYVAR